MKPTAGSIGRTFLNSGKRHLILTGSRGSGKTVRFSALAKGLAGGAAVLPGITTWAVPGDCAIICGNGLAPCCDPEAEQTSGSAQNGIIGRFDEELGRMVPVKEGFLKVGIPALEQAVESDSQWIGIDELGYLEQENEPFQNAVRRAFDRKRVLAVLRKQDLPFLNELKSREDVFVVDLDEAKAKIGCILMASGLGKRFGSDKLMADFRGKPMIARALAATDGLFDRRVVVTRSQGAAESSRKWFQNRGEFGPGPDGISDVILHRLPGRNDAVRLGVEALSDMDGLVFCSCDQPLLRRESVARMLAYPCVDDDLILRLAFGDRAGNPVLFGNTYFGELCALPEKKGGGYLAVKYPEKVKTVEAAAAEELEDVDTPEDLKRLEALAATENP